MGKIQTLIDGDIVTRNPSTGELVICHYYINRGEGSRIVWVCVNCGCQRDN